MEVLLFEYNYIKLYQLCYNVLLCDDKLYFFIFFSGDIYLCLVMYCGVKYVKGEYFGFFFNGYVVCEILVLLQKIFFICQCENSVYCNCFCFCLQYQIGCCLGLCVVGLVSEEEYVQQVEYVWLFFVGKDDQVLIQFIVWMEKVSQNLEFEEVVCICDQIQVVCCVMEKQFVFNIGDDFDVIGVVFDVGMVCVYVLFICQGKVLGS